MLLALWPNWPPPAATGQIVLAIALVVVLLVVIFFRGPEWYRLGVRWDRQTKKYEKK
ncbi:MAG: hypothetical protein UT43_C0008G0006 [Parcubacteria group bacterium GW2011_GWC1_39_29]|nr:MAG: hypothetical protein UT43_C0008G0006 [Parcubacteria group bacterium GW2011_GWC1_39_29]